MVPEEPDMTPFWKSDAVALAASVRAKDVELAKATPQRMARRDGTLRSVCGMVFTKAAKLAQ
jgi:hypothetical protein